MTQPMEQPNASWARFYVAQGFAIIPIHVLINGKCSCGKDPCGDTGDGAVPAGKNAGKHPVQSAWQQPAQWVRSEAAVQRWWGDPHGLPYSLGIVCGQASGVWILDVDPRNGGFDSLEALEGGFDVLPTTRTAETGSGGRHFYFKMPDGKRLKKGPLHKDYPGLDVQSDGAQSVLAPSTHVSGRRYSWVTAADAVIADAPKWLVDMIDGDRGHPGAGLGGTKLDLDVLMKAGVPDGQRNDTVYKVACSFARKFGVATDYEKRLVVGALEGFNREFVKPPLETSELQKIAASAIGFVIQNPGVADLPEGVKTWLESGGRGPVSPQVAAAMTPEQPSLAGQPMPERPAELGGDDATSGAAPGGGDASPSAGAGDANTTSAGTTPQDASGASAGAGASPPVPPAGGGPGGPVGPQPGPNNFGPLGLPPDPDSLGPDGTPGMRSRSDNGNARRLGDYFIDHIRYSAGLGWFRWDVLTWRHDSEDLYVTGLARELPVRIVAEIANYPAGTAPQDELIKWANTTRSAGAIRKAVGLANNDPRINVAPTTWDSDADLLGVANGVVNLRTGQLVPPSRDQYVTKRTAAAYVPGTRDTRFSIWLDQVTNGDKDLQKWLQRWAGYCLTGETREEKFLMLYGPPGTGKSTFLELLKAAAGDYGLTLQAENIMAQKFGKTNEEYYNAQIIGMRVIIVSELLEAEQMKEDSIKRLTGADSMVGRHPGGQPIQFRSHAKLTIGTNNRPRIRDNAMWRRLLLLPFLHQPPILDPSLKPYLLDPQGGLPAFLSWAVEGAVAWYMSGLGTCSVISDATSEYKEAEDELGIFLAEEFRVGEGLQVAMADVYAVWRDWQADRGVQNAGPINRLMRSLVDRGFDVEGTGRRAVVQGVALAPRAVQQQGQTNWASALNRAGI